MAIGGTTPPPGAESPLSTEPANNGQQPLRDAEINDSPQTLPKPVGRGIGDRPECFKNTLQEVLFVFMATIAMATNTFLTGSTVVITAAVGADLDMSQSQISWIAAAATLTAGAFQLTLGQLSDLIGRKIIFLTGMGAFSAGSLIMAFSQNPFWFNILCGILGLASAMVVPPAIGILGAAYSVPSRRKNWAFACFSAGNPLGFALGSIVSGVATRISDWRAGFIFIAILWALLGLASCWIVPDVEAYDKSSSFLARVKAAGKAFDVLGTILTVLGVGLLTASLTLGPADGWRTGHVIAMMILGVLLLVGFIAWESYWPNPLMPLHIWKDKTFSILLLIANLGMMSFMSSNFWLSLLFQEVRHMDALDVAVHLLPQVIAGVIWNIVVASLLHRVYNSILVAIGSLAYVAGSVLLSQQEADSFYWAFAFPSLVVTVIGADFHFNVANMYVMTSLPSHQQSLAGGIFNMLVRLSTTIGIGISTAVYSSIQATQGAQGDEFTAYRGAFYVSVGIASLACLFLPFLRLGTQGNSPKSEQVPDRTAEVAQTTEPALPRDGKQA
ncbi:major facilitator superfamily domain-containing protein [Stachybotrys elegans]|uniref:Major facilitator superfamily domain-containing protein n=1 Tax=Stachybotrys elegans TaxID=80388 RepID=A0A8K0WW49_9HYPO|nr:major facilitator superfamily domain-containing protein [Stachybotrys elegans]